MIDLEHIESPDFLKKMTINELNELATQIRCFLIENVAKTGGHLSSNLGVVELTIAMHYVFDSPTDRLIFDVGHQGYTHKILTGRAKDFSSLRKIDGLSGFLKRRESPHDVWEAGHSSTALAALSGFEIARQMEKGTYKNVALVGDGSLNSGLSFEALNFLGHRHSLAPIIILNDNQMSISKNVGSLAKLLTSLRTTKPYLKATRVGNKIPKFLKDWKDRLGRMLRGFARNMTLFDEMGFKYYGPIDGHNLRQLIHFLSIVKDINKPVVLHVITTKGKGYEAAEKDDIGKWHGVKPFDPTTSLPLGNKKENQRSWSTIIADYLYQTAQNDPDFRVVIPAMVAGSDLVRFQKDFPNQIIDVGICESFAVCFAGALSMNIKKVFVPIYSSFLQRAYDQMNHDIARQNLHVVFGIDRAGLVGEDGETHQGIYDIAYLRHLPNIEIVQGMNPEEAKALLDYAFDKAKGPIAIRYSNSSVQMEPAGQTEREIIVKPSWKQVIANGVLNLIAYGDNAERMRTLIQKEALPVSLFNARFIKPLDEEMLREILASGQPTVVLEDVTVAEGLGSAILEFAEKEHLSTGDFSILGLPDQFIEQGTVAELYERYHLDDRSIETVLRAKIKQ